jgi:hypothetical protein
MNRAAIKAKRQGIGLFITGASPMVRRTLRTHGVRPPRARYRETIARASRTSRGITESFPPCRMASPRVSPRFDHAFRAVNTFQSDRFHEHCYQQARGSPLQGSAASREKAQWTRSIWLRR